MSELKQTIRYCRAPDGKSIAWATMGSGPPLLISDVIGHLEQDLHNQVFYIPVLSALSRTHQVIRFDGRGSGLSDRDFDRVDLDSQLEDLSAVADAAGLTSFSLFASSGGAPQAIEYGARNPERVNRIATYGGIFRGLMHRNPTAKMLEMRQTLIDTILAGWDEDSFLEVVPRMLFPTATREEQHSSAQWLRASMSARRFVDQLRWFAELDATATAHRVRCPVLVMHARHDERIPFEEAQLIARLIPNARLVPVESHNNILVRSDPTCDESLRMIQEFLLEDSVGLSAPKLADLTRRELQVLELIAQGRDNLQIAAHLNLSEKTVRNHITPIFDKLQVENRAQAIVRAREAGLGGAGKPGAIRLR